MRPVSVSRPGAPRRSQTLNPLLLATLTVIPPAWNQSTGTTERQRYSWQERSMEGTISDNLIEGDKILTSLYLLIKTDLFFYCYLLYQCYTVLHVFTRSYVFMKVNFYTSLSSFYGRVLYREYNTLGCTWFVCCIFLYIPHTCWVMSRKKKHPI